MKSQINKVGEMIAWGGGVATGIVLAATDPAVPDAHFSQGNLLLHRPKEKPKENIEE